MDGGFVSAIAEWTPYFAFTGGAAAALLGLLFVAASLRLDLFRRPEVADIRDDAWFAFATLLAAMAVAGLALAPRPRAWAIAAVAVVLGGGGVAAVAWLAGQWRRVNAAVAGASHLPRPS